LAMGAHPWSVAFSPEGAFWVANRGNGTITAIRDLDKTNPTVSAPIKVGAEPTAIAVTPTGAKVAVTSYVEGALWIVDTQASTTQTVAVGANARALAISNGKTVADDQETIWVTLMFGQAIGGGGGAPSEGSDVGREGVVVP